MQLGCSSVTPAPRISCLSSDKRVRVLVQAAVLKRGREGPRDLDPMRKLLSVTSLLLIGVYGIILMLGMAVGPSRPGVVNYLKASLPKIQVLNEMAEAGLSMSGNGEGIPLRSPEAESLLFGWLVRRRLGDQVAAAREPRPSTAATAEHVESTTDRPPAHLRRRNV